MEQLHHSQATKKMDELTHSAFSPEWLQANGIQALVSPELMKVLVSQAMNVAAKAQHMGIHITPPGSDQQQANLQAQPTAEEKEAEARRQAFANAQSQVPFAPQFVPGAFLEPAAPTQ
jgi:hypothetical protein